MWVFDPKTLKFLAVNETAIERYGIRVKEFLSMLATDIRPREEERERWRDFVKAGGELTQNAAIWEHHARRDRACSPRSLRASFVSREPRRFWCLAHDITERLKTEKALRLSEAKFRRMVESSLIGIVFFDGKGLITDANDCFLRWSDGRATSCAMAH